MVNIVKHFPTFINEDLEDVYMHVVDKKFSYRYCIVM